MVVVILEALVNSHCYFGIIDSEAGQMIHQLAQGCGYCDVLNISVNQPEIDDSGIATWGDGFGSEVAFAVGALAQKAKSVAGMSLLMKRL